VIIVLLAPPACRILGIPSTGDPANIFESGQELETKTHHPLRFLQIDSLPILVESATLLLMLGLEQPSELRK
jgi:hypothetical protein